MFEPSRTVLAALIFLLFVEAPCSADEPCKAPLTADKVVSCALSVSPEVRIARRQFDALRGRHISAGIWLPSNPDFSFSAAERHLGQGTAGGSAFNWDTTVSQEVEIAGQRGARLRVVDAEVQAQLRRVVVTELEVAAKALTVFDELEAADEEVRLAKHLSQIADSLSRLADERTKGGLLSGVDADVAKSESVRIGIARYQAQRRYSAALADLNVLLGRGSDEPVELPGRLDAFGMTPVEAENGERPFVARALLVRGEIGAAEAERAVLERQLELLKRERIPNLTLSAFARRDETSDRIFGGGISMPLPLPAPIGQTKAGEIEETIAKIDQAKGNVELIRRRVQTEAAQAYSEWQASTEALKAFRPDLVARSSEDLGLISDAIGSRQLSVRDALLAQRSLIELLSEEIEARRNHSLAWVNLMRVGGFSLPGMEQ